MFLKCCIRLQLHLNLRVQNVIYPIYIVVFMTYRILMFRDFSYYRAIWYHLASDFTTSGTKLGSKANSIPTLRAYNSVAKAKIKLEALTSNAPTIYPCSFRTIAPTPRTTSVTSSAPSRANYELKTRVSTKFRRHIYSQPT